MEISKKTSVFRLKEIGDRDATVLEHDSLRVMIDDIGGMIPELSLIRGKQHLNAHWTPWFRSNSGKPFRESEDGSFWKDAILYNLAGNFPCIPSFGAGHVIDGFNMPSHGWSANLTWVFRASGIDEESGAVWALSTMDSPEKAMPVSLKKIDALIPGQNAHYSSVTVSNPGNIDLEICAGWHNTLGAPFLAEGCRISCAATAWETAPLESEFDTTTRLVPAAEFSSLSRAPLSAGGKADLSYVPGPIGYTDFAAGRIDSAASLGWSSLVNPGLKTAYICFFPGPASAMDDDFIFNFNLLWMQYGGRHFTPWAPYEGGTDITFCLGTENATSAYSQGLEYSRKIGKVMGAPATITIPGKAQKVIRYGTLFAPYENSILDEGIFSLQAEGSALISAGKGGNHQRFSADPFFTALKALEKSVKY